MKMYNYESSCINILLGSILAEIRINKPRAGFEMALLISNLNLAISSSYEVIYVISTVGQLDLATE